MAEESVQVRRVTLLESDLPKMVVKGWLSRCTSFVVTIDGPFGAKEGAALMSLLGAQLEVLADGVPPGDGGRTNLTDVRSQGGGQRNGR